jgi:hypothetical protein
MLMLIFWVVTSTGTVDTNVSEEHTVSIFRAGWTSLHGVTAQKTNIDNIRIDLKGTVCEHMDWIQLAQNRDN